MTTPRVIKTSAVREAYNTILNTGEPVRLEPADAGKAPRVLKTEIALQALIDAWIDERGCSRLVAAGRAANAAKREYEAISKRVNVPS